LSSESNKTGDFDYAEVTRIMHLHNDYAFLIMQSLGKLWYHCDACCFVRAARLCAEWCVCLLRPPLPSESAPQLPSESARHGACGFARKREFLQFLLSFGFPVLTSNT
jgi:hypothetical protein